MKFLLIALSACLSVAVGIETLRIKYDFDTLVETKRSNIKKTISEWLLGVDGNMTSLLLSHNDMQDQISEALKKKGPNANLDDIMKEIKEDNIDKSAGGISSFVSTLKKTLKNVGSRVEQEATDHLFGVIGTALSPDKATNLKCWNDHKGNFEQKFDLAWEDMSEDHRDLFKPLKKNFTDEPDRLRQIVSNLTSSFDMCDSPFCIINKYKAEKDSLKKDYALHEFTLWKVLRDVDYESGLRFDEYKNTLDGIRQGFLDKLQVCANRRRHEK